MTGDLSQTLLAGHLELARELAGTRQWMPSPYKLAFVVLIWREDPAERDRWARRWLIGWASDGQRPPSLQSIATVSDLITGLPKLDAARDLAEWCRQNKHGFAGDVVRVVLLNEPPLQYYLP